MSGKQSGVVKFFNDTKGFGFIIEETGKDLFFHATKVKGELPKEGQTVKYNIGQGKKGVAAIDVELA